MEVLIVAVASLLAIAAAAALAPRVRIAAPLLLVALGIAVSFIPAVPPIEVDPEWVLAGLLPPLLYSASVSMPAMSFRRELRSIGGLSVVLVVVSSVVLGLFFAAVIPGVDLWWGIALGAVVSPTDAVATTIIKRLGASPRVVSVLEGESLLNDATALVLLRSAVAGASVSISAIGVIGDFVFAVVVAVVIGIAVGIGNLRVRARVADAAVNTVLSFTVPFLASIPAELLGASGLVAAVVAGLVTGHRAPRVLPPQHRLSDAQSWRTVELVLEGSIFLLMGLEIFGIIDEVHETGQGLDTAFALAAAALLLVLLVRAAYVALLLVGLHRRAERKAAVKPRLDVLQERLDQDQPLFSDPRAAQRFSSPEHRQRFATRIRRGLADIDYLLTSPLRWREGTILVWAGMRGAVTVAAAQTLPADTPSRALLVLIAFLTAAGSLLLQGGTLALVLRRLGSDPGAEAEAEARVAEDRGRLLALLRETEAEVRAGWPGPEPSKALTLAILHAQRETLLDVRDDGLFDPESLTGALAVVDADQMSIELKGAPADPAT
ncbi:sodium:proton antiporter [Nocardioides sp. BGMRC 2183]|nr:sodium:proton antiporter [Nocardioides sp. BGMRC 2183]